MPDRLSFLLLLSSIVLSAMVGNVVQAQPDSATIQAAFGACVSDTGVNFACIQSAIADLNLDPSVLAGLASCAGTDLTNIDIAATTACVQEQLAGMGSGGEDENQDPTETKPEADCAACEACTP